VRRGDLQTPVRVRDFTVSWQTRDVPIGGGRVLKATPVFDTYWRFAQARQEILHRRVKGETPPWTDDPILAAHRFTNAYRAADRVSQFLIRHVIYSGPQTAEELFFRIFFFKIFNRIETWKSVESVLGQICWEGYEFERYAKALDCIRVNGSSIYSNAYIMPSPHFGELTKHRNHLLLLEHMMRESVPRKVAGAKSLEQVFRILLEYPSLGRFLAFQFTIDLNYSALRDFSEMDFVVAGPGARDGIKKCFVDTAGLDDADVIRIVTEQADEQFKRLGITFSDLWGRQLQLIDCQNLFCEVDKYSRVAHPEVQGLSGRTRIKQRFVAAAKPLPQWYPPKWGVLVPDRLAAAETNEYSACRGLPFGDEPLDREVA
jgi:hypothetical protein